MLVIGSSVPKTVPVLPWQFSGCIAAWSIDDVILSSGRVSQWNDKSGNGNSLVQSSTAAQWTWTANGAIPPPGQNIGYDLTGLSINYQSLTVVWIGSPIQAPINQNGTLIATNPVSTGGMIAYSNEPSITIYNPTRFIGTVFSQPVNGVATAFSSTLTTVCSNGLFFTGTGNNSGTDTLTKLFIFEGGQYPWGNPTIACYVFNRTLSQQEISSIFSYHGVSSVGDNVLNFTGDSLTIGSNASTLAQSYSGIAAAQLPVTPKYSAQSGATMAVIASLNSSMVNASYVPGKTNLTSLFAGTNDLATNGSVGTLETNYQSFCAARKTFNPQWKVIACTILPRSASFSGGQDSAGFETARNTFNTWLRANWSTFADALVDFAANSTIGPQAAASNVTYYSDGVHLTNAGHAIAGQVFLDAVSPLFATVKLVSSGTVVLVSGTQSITNAAITTRSTIIPTLRVIGGTVSGPPTVQVFNGTALFTGAITDTSTYNWILVGP